MIETGIISSKLFSDAVNELAKLPGVGRKTATRLILHLLRQNPAEVENLGNALIKMRFEIVFCELCHNISDTPRCHICSDNRRDHSTVCVVEGIQDVIAIENTRQFKGVYHVLGGIISPLDGISPQQLNIESLAERVQNSNILELIFALPTTMEGDTTGFYLYRKLHREGLKITTIAKGISVGDELQYADEITLGQSLINRRLFQS